MRDQRAIVAEGLAKRFGQVCALRGVDLELPVGSVLGLLGPNGAGKTTMVRILSTLVPPDGGCARVAGYDVVKQAGAVRGLIGLSGQYAAVDTYLTGRENLVLIGRLCGLGRRAAYLRAGELLERFDLAAAADRRTGSYSGGMRRRLDIAASLVAAPPVLFLDEPTTGLDPHGRIAVWQLVDELTAQGTSLLLTTQYMEEADRLADHIIVIDNGGVIAAGSPDQLKSQVGGDRLELRTMAGDDPRELAGALSGLGSGPPAIDVASRRVVLPVTDGPAVLPELAARLAASRIRVADLAVRRPTLDDVFLTLTGHPGAGSAGSAAAPACQRRDPCADTADSDANNPAATMNPVDVDTARHAAMYLRPIANVRTLTGRNLRRLARVPTLIALATVQPVLLVVLFTYVFGGAVHAPGVASYIDFLLPGIFVLAIGFGASQTAVAIAEDLASGIIDRFRSLPLADAAVLAGRVTADTVRNVFVVGLMIMVGFAMGFRFHAGPIAALAAFALAVAGGFAFSWLNALLGLLVRNPESAGLAGLFPVIILVFTSSTLVPVATMPGWLQAFAKVNPITVVVDALRALCLGGPTATRAAEALAWIGALLVVTVPAAIIRYRQTTTDG